MSSRRRAVPWFLERPPHYINERKLAPGGFGEVVVWRDWSWDTKTWFSGDGTCYRPGFYRPGDAAPPHLVELYPVVGKWLEMEKRQAIAANEKLIGTLIASVGARA